MLEASLVQEKGSSWLTVLEGSGHGYSVPLFWTPRRGKAVNPNYTPPAGRKLREIGKKQTSWLLQGCVPTDLNFFCPYFLNVGVTGRAAAQPRVRTARNRTRGLYTH